MFTRIPALNSSLVTEKLFPEINRWKKSTTRKLSFSIKLNVSFKMNTVKLTNGRDLEGLMSLADERGEGVGWTGRRGTIGLSQNNTALEIISHVRDPFEFFQFT